MSYNLPATPFPLYTAVPFLSGQTPGEVFERISACPDLFWLDSGDSSGDRLTYLGAFSDQSLVDYDFVIKKLFENKLIVANRIKDSGEKSKVSASSYIGTGWVGQINYEQHATTLAQNAPKLHSAIFKHYSTLLAFSHAEAKWTLVTSRAANLAEIHDKWFNAKPSGKPALPAHSRARSNVLRCQFETIVRKVLDYISAGDIYQANISQKFSVGWSGRPEDLYLRLRAESPAEFGAYLSPSFLESPAAICSISPELFMSVRDGIVETRPIKGTRPRPTLSNLEAMISELNSNQKEIAELNMIIDLERNDLGRVCEYGSVEVVSRGHVEVLPTLLHRVGTVRGRLRNDASLQDLFEAAFPGGSVTGAPKIRAMEIIRELEPEPRGPYCGTIGWIGDDGSMKFNLAIRTAVLDTVNRIAHYHAGSGIVADSDPSAEYEETLQKAAAFFRATNSTLTEG